MYKLDDCVFLHCTIRKLIILLTSYENLTYMNRINYYDNDIRKKMYV